MSFASVKKIVLIATLEALTTLGQVTTYGAAYTFTNLADNTGALLDFNGPSINNAGVVAFRASLDSGGAGIYRGTPGGLSTIAETGHVYQGFQYQTPGIAADGRIAFTALRHGEAGGGVGVFIGNGTSVDVYALTPTTMAPQPDDYAGFQSTVLSSNGTPAYVAPFVGNPLEGIRSGVYVGGSRVVDDRGPYLSFADSLGRGLDINNNGQVVFKADLDDNTSGIYLRGSGSSKTIADTTGGFASFSFSVPAINDAGDIVFYTEHDPFDAALYTASASSGVPTLYVDRSGAFSGFGNAPALNELGDIAFTARLDVLAQGNGIFTGPDSIADKVVLAGDPLFGSTFGEAFISNASMNDAGQIAFVYSLTDGRVGIAVATPVPQLNGDYNENGTVDAADFVLWRDNLGHPAGALPNDPTGAMIGLSQYNVWRANFGAMTAGGAAVSATPVPEPNGVSIWGIFFALTLRRTIRS